MNEQERIERALLGALRGMVVGDAIGAAGEGLAPEEIEEVYDGPITELTDPANLYPERAPDRVRGQIGPVSESALAFARRLTAGEGAAVASGMSWPIVLGLVLPRADATSIVEATRSYGGAAPACALAGAVTAALGGYLARDAVGLAAEVAGRAGDQALAGLLVEAAGAAQASGGRMVGEAVAEIAPPWGEFRDSVAFAIGVAFGGYGVRRAVLAAANGGGHASFTAAAAGALCGALAPGSNVQAWSDEVASASGLDLAAVAAGLIRVRWQTSAVRGSSQSAQRGRLKSW